MYGIAMSLDESGAPMDAQFSTVVGFYQFDDMSWRQEGASLSILIDLSDQFLLLRDRGVSSGRGRTGRMHAGATVVEGLL